MDREAVSMSGLLLQLLDEGLAKTAHSSSLRGQRAAGRVSLLFLQIAVQFRRVQALQAEAFFRRGLRDRLRNASAVLSAGPFRGKLIMFIVNK